MTSTGKFLLLVLATIALQPFSARCYDIPRDPGLTEPHQPTRRCDFVLDWERYAARVGEQLMRLSLAMAITACAFKKPTKVAA